MTIYGLQFDSTGVLPFTPALQAFYVNGLFARRPVSYGRGKVWIDVTGAEPRAAFWLDVERFDATPAVVPGWLDARRLAGLGDGGVYCNRSTLPAVLASAGPRMFSLWLATLDGTTDPGVQLPGSVTLCAVQAFPAAMAGFDADVSVVVDQAYWVMRADV